MEFLDQFIRGSMDILRGGIAEIDHESVFCVNGISVHPAAVCFLILSP